jgi:hypothetical protein
MDGNKVTEGNGWREAVNVLNVYTLQKIRSGCAHWGLDGVQRRSHYTAREVWKVGMGWKESFGTSLAAWYGPSCQRSVEVRITDLVSLGKANYVILIVT